AQCRQPIASSAATPCGAVKPMAGGVPEARNWPEVSPPGPYLMSNVGTAPVPAMGNVHVNQVPYGSYGMMPGMLNPSVPQPVTMSNPAAMGLGPGLFHAHVPPPPAGGPGAYEHPESVGAVGPVGAWPTWTG
ncbi:unnamed protein product, partial [Symbiodinium pilosum]